ncbi:MAG: radical SAM protein [Syntrophaceae bacterium]|nr:radical SAM protein [Syntrophaceae bacterium]
MKIVFFNISHENLAVSILSAIAKKEGHSVKLLHIPNLFNNSFTMGYKRLAKLFNNDKDLFRQLETYQPDLIAFSVVTFHYQQALHYAEISKKICPRTKIVFGGIHVSCVPEVVIANDFIDYIVIGEGEIAFSQIIKHIEKGSPPEPIVNTWYKTKDKTIIKGKQLGFIQDLDNTSPFDKEIWKEILPLKTYYLTMTSRGCPYNCTYCFNHFFRDIPQEKSKYVRHRSIENIIKELTTNKSRLNFKTIEFWDDIFILDKKWLKEFLEAYKKKVALPFKCYIHVDLFDEETAIMLKDAGCKWADFGIQSINEEYRKKYLNRPGTNTNIIKTLKLLKKHKIVSFADYIIGLPGDTLKNFEEARLFFLENMPDIIEPYWMSYHPKTEIIEKALELKILDEEKIDLINHGKNPHSYYESCLGGQDFHSQYYFIFKVFPSLPVFLRKKFTYKLAQKIPYFMKFIFLGCSFIYLSFKHNNLRTKYLIMLYIKQIFWTLNRKLLKNIIKK